MMSLCLIHNSELEKMKEIIKYEMENAFKLEVPLDVELGAGKIGWKPLDLKIKTR
jgi:DNA polymerase I-like protein with 3'-5' exonuclease and polymerase domains